MNDRSSIMTAAPACPTRAWLTRRDDVHNVAMALVDTARRTIRCMHRDLAAFGLATPPMVERLHRFLHSHRSARLRLLVDDAAWFERNAPRLKLLQQQFTHALQVRVASHEDPVGEDGALLIDDVHSLVLTRTAQGIGEVWFGNAPRAQPLISGFEHRWQAAGYNLAVTPLGL